VGADGGFVRGSLSAMDSDPHDPFLAHVLAAEEDDEELNEVGLRMLREAREDSEAGRTYSLEEVKRELGI